MKKSKHKKEDPIDDEDHDKEVKLDPHTIGENNDAPSSRRRRIGDGSGVRPPRPKK